MARIRSGDCETCNTDFCFLQINVAAVMSGTTTQSGRAPDERPKAHRTMLKTAHQMGWTTIKGRELLALAAPRFDLFVTVDRNLSFQQNLMCF
jgi:hypothetical protein